MYGNAPLAKTVGVSIMGAAMIITLPTMARMFISTLAGLDAPTGSEENPPPAPPVPASPPPVPPAPAEPTDWSFVAGVGVSVLAVVVGIVAITLVWRYLAHRRIGKRAQQARRADQIALWQQGVTALAETSEALMGFEGDPESVYFTRRLLADVNEPATAAFYTAYGTAQSLHTEVIPTETDMITKFVEAAVTARRAFGTAAENARRKARLGISHDGHRLTIGERRKIGQAQKLMRQAHDPVATEAYAHNALAKALELLDSVGAIVPERLTANVTRSIETIHRRALAG